MFASILRAFYIIFLLAVGVFFIVFLLLFIVSNQHDVSVYFIKFQDTLVHNNSITVSAWVLIFICFLSGFFIGLLFLYIKYNAIFQKLKDEQGKSAKFNKEIVEIKEKMKALST